MVNFNRDSIAGLVLLIFSLIFIFYITPDQVEMHKSVAMALSPRLFCYLTGGLLAMLSVILILLSLKKGGLAATGETRQTSWTPLFRGLLCTAIACAYAALAGLLGFFVSTALAMTVFLVYFGVKKWAGILLFLIIVLGFIYLLFVEALKVVMPDGLFF